MLDASIYGRFQPKSATAFAGEFAELANVRDQRQANALSRAFMQQRMEAEQAQQQRVGALRALQQSLAGRPEAEMIEGVRAGGFPEEAAKMDRDYLERSKLRGEVKAQPAARAKDEATAAKTRVEAIGQALQQYQGLIPRIQNVQHAQQWLQGQYADPILGEIMPQVMGPIEQAIGSIPQDPEGFARWRDEQGMGMVKFREMLAAQARDAEVVRANQAREGLTRRGQDVQAATTRRGQDMADRRAAEAAARAATPDNKPLTEGQAKAVLFGNRALEANKMLEEVERIDGVTQPGKIKRAAETAGQIIGLGTSFGDVLGSTAGSLTNWTQSEAQQRVEQAQRDFINAILRRESGAVIADSEFDNARKQYFPQPGDSPQVIEQKRRNRDVAIRGILAEAPENRRAIPGAPQSQGPRLDNPDAGVIDWNSLPVGQ